MSDESSQGQDRLQRKINEVKRDAGAKSDELRKRLEQQAAEIAERNRRSNPNDVYDIGPGAKLIVPRKKPES